MRNLVAILCTFIVLSCQTGSYAATSMPSASTSKELSSLKSFGAQTSNLFYQDLQLHYQQDRLKSLGLFLAGTGLSANTSIDKGVRHFWKTSIKSPGTNRVASWMCAIKGEGIYFIPLYLAAAYIGSGNESRFGRWGSESFRSALLVTPEYFAINRLLGAARPQHGSSRWFNHEKYSVSGHALYGALPFITLAQQIDNPWGKGAAYALSTLPGLARIDKDKHYFSQVTLGWGLAYLAAQTTHSISTYKNLKIEPAMLRSGKHKSVVGLRVKYLL